MASRASTHVRDAQTTKPLVTVVPARAGACAIYDPVRERMVVFGGRNATTMILETWVLSLSSDTPTWSRLTTSGFVPEDVYKATAVYDPVRDRMLVITGCSLAGQTELGVFELKFATSTWSALTTYTYGSFPPSRCAHSAIYDPIGDRIIMFGGSAQVSEGTPLGDTWELKLSGPPPNVYPLWQPITSPGAPGARFGHSAIYDPGTQQMFLMGGIPDSSPYFLTFWTLSLPAGGTPIWTHRNAQNAPTIRHYQSAIFDPNEQRVVLFGGRQEWQPSLPCDDTRSASLWFTPDPNYFGWGQYVPGSPAPWNRYLHVAVYDPQPPNNRMIVFGGWRAIAENCSGNYTNETWSLSMIRNSLGVPWTQISSTAVQALRLAPHENQTSQASFAIWPNPVSDHAQLSVEVPTAQHVVIDVFDIAGRRVDMIANTRMEPGARVIEWAAKDASGQRVRPGVYRCRVVGETFSATRMVVVLP